MARKFIEIGGKPYRVEANWNAISEFLDDRGKNLSDMAHFQDFNTGDLNTLLYRSVEEGERLEGRDLGMTKKDFLAQIGAGTLVEFLTIFTKQYVPEGESEEAGSEKKV